MNDPGLQLILVVAGGFVALLALAFGIWVGLGSPGLYDKYEQTGRAPRASPWRWLLGGRQRARSSRFDAVLREEEEDVDEAQVHPERARPNFKRGRRFRR